MKGTVVALALTWDGTRWPIRSLPPEARSFLAAGKSVPAPPAAKVAKLFQADRIKEIRVCWIPRLKGGTPVLAEPFTPLGGKRLPFRAVRHSPFGDILGVIYRR